MLRSLHIPREEDSSADVYKSLLDPAPSISATEVIRALVELNHIHRSFCFKHKMSENQDEHLGMAWEVVAFRKNLKERMLIEFFLSHNGQSSERLLVDAAVLYGEEYSEVILEQIRNHP